MNINKAKLRILSARAYRLYTEIIPMLSGFLEKGLVCQDELEFVFKDLQGEIIQFDDTVAGLLLGVVSSEVELLFPNMFEVKLSDAKIIAKFIGRDTLVCESNDKVG